MKRANKRLDSEIILENITYRINGNNKYLAQILKNEQKNFCAYTEKQFSSTDLVEIDHFNPTLKGQSEDNYDNWYLIFAKWNRNKSTKWSKFQPILHPKFSEFSSKIWYEDNIFQYNINDVEAKNLVSLLDLNNYELTKERVSYIERLKELQNQIGIEGLRNHLLKYKDQIHFISAFEEAFGYSFIF